MYTECSRDARMEILVKYATISLSILLLHAMAAFSQDGAPDLSGIWRRNSQKSPLRCDALAVLRSFLYGQHQVFACGGAGRDITQGHRHSTDSRIYLLLLVTIGHRRK